jgi:Tfp pilus assembly protein PilF
MTKPRSAGGAQTPAVPVVQTPLDRAWAAYGAQDLAQAQREVQGLLEQSPHDVEAAYLAGLVARAQGAGDRATAAFQVVVDHHAQIADATRARMLRRLAVGHLNQLSRGQWDLEPETWVRT